MRKSVRIEIGKKRLVRILQAQTVCCDRTLEQKISDAGPNPMRVEPVILTEARWTLEKEKVILFEKHRKTPWYFLKETPRAKVDERLAELLPLYEKTQAGPFINRLGQVLEIAVFRAIQKTGMPYFGNFTDLDKHDDSTSYTKSEPPQNISGNRIEKGPLDFLVFPRGIATGIEVKNYRTWVYPKSTEVRELLWKCGDADAVPVLIARRLPFLTIRLLQMSGCLIHENYNQLYPAADGELAAAVRNKNSLGYHDVRTGNNPDARMTRFIGELMPALVEQARETFVKFRDVHRAYGKGEIKYGAWLKELRARGKAWGREVRNAVKEDRGPRK